MSKFGQPCRTTKRALKSSYCYKHDDAMAESVNKKKTLVKQFLESLKKPREKNSPGESPGNKNSEVHCHV